MKNTFQFVNEKTHQMKTNLLSLLSVIFSAFGCNKGEEHPKMIIEEFDLPNHYSWDLAANYIRIMKEYDVYYDTVLTKIFYLNERGLPDSVQRFFDPFYFRGVKYFQGNTEIYNYNSKGLLRLTYDDSKRGRPGDYPSDTTHYSYFNKQNVLIEYLDYTGKPVEQTLFLYDEIGNCIRQKTQCYMGNMEMRNFRVELKYDSVGNLLQADHYENSELQTSDYFTYRFKDFKTCMLEKDTLGRIKSTVYKTYDSLGRLLENEEIIFRYGNQNYTLYYKTKYFYDHKNLCIKVLKFGESQRQTLYEFVGE